MSPIRDSPIQLDVANRLIYSFHIYSWQYLAPTRRSYEKFRDGLDQDVTYMLEEGHEYTAPVWVGEFGDNSQERYWNYLIRYLQDRPTIGWAYWSYNGYQLTPEDDESFGIMDASMTQVRDDWKLADLQTIMDPNTISQESILQE